ncbi:MAG: tRNA (adenosine(37)-N6)-threonylcarbamoyltransferase complex dimerization subunit type 1 TsaB [Rhodobacteraceae bacterium]|nr:tRNA (adenosine(37)-N6)-threonylcarbamoyltransferase complex dimerization subunit type 1 TsaB [Paracoccaceae bacterium]
MPSDPLILAFDTSAAHCAAALLSGNTVLTQRTELMSRGQAERLMPLLQDVLAKARRSWSDLDAIGVGVGPGNFTGIRIGVSAARGLALGLSVPAVGVTGCEARSMASPAPGLIAILAPRDQVYLCNPTDPSINPELMSLDAAQQTAHSLGRSLITDTTPQQIAIAIARIAGTRWQTTTTSPVPLYVRQADAAPSRDKLPDLIE